MRYLLQRFNLDFFFSWEGAFAPFFFYTPINMKKKYKLKDKFNKPGTVMTIKGAKFPLMDTPKVRKRLKDLKIFSLFFEEVEPVKKDNDSNIEG